MEISPIIERTLRPFSKVSEGFILQAPNRFAVPISRKRKSVLGTRKQEGAYWVLGTIPQRFAHSAWFSMPALGKGMLKQLEDDRKVPNFDTIRARTVKGRFILRAEQLALIRRSIKILNSSDISIITEGGEVLLNACFLTDKSKVPLGGHEGNRFSLRAPADVIAPFSRSFPVDIVRLLRDEDHEVTLYAEGVVEMQGVESGLVFLIPTAVA